MKREGTETGPIVDQKARDVLVVHDSQTEVGDDVGQGVEDGPAGVVTRIAGSPVAMSAEEPLVELPLWRARQGTPPVRQLLDRGRRLAGDYLDDPRVGKKVALPNGIGEMLFPRVLGVTRPQGGVDAAGGQGGVRVAVGALGDYHHFGAGTVRRNRRPQTGGPRAYHQDIANVGTDVGCDTHRTASPETSRPLSRRDMRAGSIV